MSNECFISLIKMSFGVAAQSVWMAFASSKSNDQIAYYRGLISMTLWPMLDDSLGGIISDHGFLMIKPPLYYGEGRGTETVISPLLSEGFDGEDEDKDILI